MHSEVESGVMLYVSLAQFPIGAAAATKQSHVLKMAAAVTVLWPTQKAVTLFYCCSNESRPTGQYPYTVIKCYC